MPSAGVSDGAQHQEDNVLSHVSNAAYERAAPGAPMTAKPIEAASGALLETILTSLSDDKAEDVVSIDLSGKTEIADFMVVASGRSTRQVTAIAEKLAERIKAATGHPSKIEGKDQGDWVLIDAGDVVVHIFRPEVREFYQLEKMWVTPGSSAALS